MRANGWIVLFLICYSATSNAREDLSEAPRVPAPSESDPILSNEAPLGSQARTAFEQPSTFKLNAAPLGRRSTDRQIGDAIGFVRFSAGLLARPVETELDLRKPVLTSGLPVSMARLSLTLDGREYQLFFESDALEARTGFRHVRMNVLNEDNATARFTVSRDGKNIYGVLRAGGQTYVLEPSGAPGEQVVYRYEKSRATDDRRRGLIGNSAIARRHHQLEALTEIAPDYSTSDAYSAYLIGGKLGTARSITPASFVQAAERLSSITQFKGTEQFELIGIRPTQDGGRLAIFNQMVGTIPIDAVNEMQVDRNGKIVRLATSIFPISDGPPRPLLTTSEAETKVRDAWKERYGRRLSSLTTEAPLKVRYRFNRSSGTLDPLYQLTFYVDGVFSTFHATVDAVSGSVDLSELSYNSVDYTSCADVPLPIRPGGWPPIGSCNAPSGTKGYAYPDTPGYCSESTSYPFGTYCGGPGAKTVLEVMGDIRNNLPGAIATNAPGTPACCNDLSNVTVIQSSRAPDLDSSVTRGTLVLMPSADNQSEEILAHEMAHVYTNVYNNDALEVGTNVFAGAVREGSAYTFAGIIGAISGRSTRYGTQWVYGDGSGYAAPVMSASNDSFKYWQDITLAAGSHASGQVIFRFFRRLQEVSGISNQRLLGILAGMMAASRDLEGNGYDAGDFKRAVLSTIRSDEAALRTAVTQIYQELYRADAASPEGTVPLPPGDPGPIGAPPISPSVWGSFNSCGTYNNVYVSVFDMYWTPTANTDRYIGWVKTDAEPAFRYGDQTIGNHLFILTNTNGESRVSSCNGSGCSGMSISRLVVSHACGG